MNYRILATLLCVSFAPWTLHAQQPSAKKPLADQQKLGQRIFQQRCSICHTLAMVTSTPYGPLLSKEVVEGRESSVRTTILEGATGLMPSFRYGLEPVEIDAIVAYLVTVEKPAQPITNWTARH